MQLTSPRALPRLGQLETAARHAMIGPLVVAMGMALVVFVAGTWPTNSRIILGACMVVGVGCILSEILIPWERVPVWLYLFLPIAGLTDIGIGIRYSGGWDSPFMFTLILPVVFAAIATGALQSLPVALVGGLTAASPALYSPGGHAPLIFGGAVLSFVALTVMVAQLMEYVRLGDRTAMEQLKARQATERYAADLVVLQRLSALVSSHLSLEEAMKAGVDALEQAFGHPRVAIYLRHGDVLLLEACRGFESIDRVLHLDQGWIGSVAVSGHTASESGREGEVSRVCLPLRDGDSVGGVLLVESLTPLTRIDQELLDLFASQVGVAVRNARLTDELRFLATHDPVTGLLNHRALMEGLDRKLEHEERCAVLIIDMNAFKSFNDTFGHPAGDAILQQVASVLGENCRDADLVARFGGDEFAMVVPDVDRSEAESLAARLTSSVRESPYRTTDGLLVPVSVSIGVAVSPDDGAGREQLIARADERMYTIKHQYLSLHQPTG